MADDDERPSPAIPLTWKDGATGEVHSQQMLVQRPTEGEVNVFSQQRVKTCADCKHFDRNEKTLKKFRDTKFFRELVHGYQWKLKYLPGKPEELGLCGVRSGTVVGPTSKACDHYKLKSGR